LLTSDTVAKAKPNKKHTQISLNLASNKLCAWGYDTPPPLFSPRGRQSASRAAEQTQRSSSFPRPIRPRGHRCTCITR